MLSVGYVVSTLERTGPTRQLLNLASNLDRDRFRVRVLTLSGEPADSLQPEFERADIAVDSLARGRLAGMLHGRRHARGWVREHGIDLLHTQGIRADLLACTLDAVPRMATLRNDPYQDYPMAYGRPGYAMAWLHCAALRRLTQVAVVSEANRQAVQRRGVSARVIPNGVALDHFAVPSAALRAERRRSLGLPEANPVMVTVGALSERKQPGLAIAAALEVREAHILVVGDGPLRETITKRYRDHPRVHLLGPLDDVENALQAADVFVSMSRAEGLPNAVMEAMACGLPGVLSDIPPHREMLAAAAAPCGELVPRGDAAAAGAALARAWTARDEWGPAAHAHAMNEYAAPAMADRYAGMYEALVADADTDSALGVARRG